MDLAMQEKFANATVFQGIHQFISAINRKASKLPHTATRNVLEHSTTSTVPSMEIKDPGHTVETKEVAHLMVERDPWTSRCTQNLPTSSSCKATIEESLQSTEKLRNILLQ
jgi:hypothetical protein